MRRDRRRSSTPPPLRSSEPGNRPETGTREHNRGQFPPGVSGNPSGRPKGTAGIAARIREHCGDDFAQLVDAWMCMAFGNAADRRSFFGEVVTVTAKDRLAALAELRDTAIGRPRQTLEHEIPQDKPRTQLVIVVEHWGPDGLPLPEPLTGEFTPLPPQPNGSHGNGHAHTSPTFSSDIPDLSDKRRN